MAKSSNFLAGVARSQPEMLLTERLVITWESKEGKGRVFENLLIEDHPMTCK